MQMDAVNLRQSALQIRHEPAGYIKFSLSERFASKLPERQGYFTGSVA
jgi:hypothetical protein